MNEREIELKLNECKTVKEMFNVLESYYDLKECKPNLITKPLFINGILKGIKMLNPVKK